jgi:hypothetical protein
MNQPRYRFLPLLIALILYGIAAFYQLNLPGLHHDEAQEAGLAAMQLKNGLPVTLFRDTGIVFAGRTFPLMVQDYIGSLNVYLAWIAFAIGGVSVESLRAMTVLTGMLTLITTFGAARELAGWRTASLTVLLLAVHPTYIFWTRQGVYVTSYTLTLGMASLWLLLRWWQGGKAWNLWEGAFLLGVGLWGKLLFLWLIGGIGGAWFLVNLPHLVAWLRRRETLRPKVTTHPLQFLVAVLLGILGMLPLIDYNAKTGGTFQNIFNNLDQSYYGVDNSNVVANFQERIKQAPTVFESSHLRELGGQFRNPWAREWLIVSGGACLLAAGLFRQKRGVRLFMVVMVLLMIAQSSFTSTALWFTHFALILPFMVMLGAVGAAAVGDILRRMIPPHLADWVMVGLVLAVMGSDALTAWRYHDALRQTGGIATHSAVIYDLADELDRLPPASPVAALDWGIGPAVTMLTEGRIVPNEVFGYDWTPDPGFPARLQPFFALDESLYILHVPSETTFPRREVFFQLAAENGRVLELYRTLTDRRGNPYFEIWRAVE